MTTCTVAFGLALITIVLGCHGVHGWGNYAHATYYGGSDASGTNDGSCGYSNVFTLGYGTMTTALSGVLFNNGLSCGGCYQIRCSGDSACYSNTITVTATNFCPQGSYGGWCDFPNAHFDLSQPAFQQIAQVAAGHVSVEYQQVSCSKTGSIQFAISGHTYWMSVMVYNVGGMGAVTAVSVMGSSSSDWIPLMRTWGQNWETGSVLDGQRLGFAVTTSDGKTVTSSNVAGSNWQYGQTFQGLQF